MARWQYDTYLIPQARLFAVFGKIPETVTEAEERSLHWDERHQPPADYAARLSAFLKPASSWHEDVQIWGKDLGNRVDITTSQGGVETIFVRFDAREAAATPFLIRMADFAHHLGAVFLTYEGHVITPSVRALLADLRQSPARRFVLDPKTRHVPDQIEEAMDASPTPAP
jgi:hypothetical protein